MSLIAVGDMPDDDNNEVMQRAAGMFAGSPQINPDKFAVMWMWEATPDAPCDADVYFFRSAFTWQWDDEEQGNE